MLVNWQNRQKQKMTKCVETGANGHQQAQTGKNGKKTLARIANKGQKIRKLAEMGRNKKHAEIRRTGNNQQKKEN